MDFGAEIVQSFLEEAQESIDLLDRELVRLEENPESQEIFDEIFRAFHTLKGNAGMLGLHRFEKIAHVTEEILTEIRNGNRTIDGDLITFMLDAVDSLKELLIVIEQTGSDVKTPGQRDDAAATSAAAPSETGKESDAPTKGGKSKKKKKTKAQSAHTPAETAEPSTPEPDLPEPDDDASTDAAESETAISPEKQAPPKSGKKPETAPTAPPNSAGDAQHSKADSNGQATGTKSKSESAIRVDVHLLDNLMNMVGELVLARNQIIQFAAQEENAAFLASAQRLNLVTGELQEGIMKTRMQPIGNIFSRFPRVVRDVSRALNKQVIFKTEGEDTELDKTIIEGIRDPLIHLIRNAIDHGIEDPETRIQKGKDPKGLIFLRAYHEGGQVNLEIIDDGAGIDVNRIRQKALEKGIVTEQQLNSMSDRDAIQLIFKPGFSTAEKVTNISGRGVGMDVVRTDIEKIGGTVEIQSEPGKGTTIKIKIPLTLAIIPALVVSSGQQRFAIPQINLLELVCLEPEDAGRLEKVGNAEVFRLRGDILPILRLNRVLHLPEPENPAGDSINIVVLSTGNTQFGLVIDTIHDTEEIVVKPLSKHLKDIDCFAGATIMGDGRVALILDVVGLSNAARLMMEENIAAEDQDESVSVVEDTSHSLLLFTIHPENQFALPASLVSRLETFPASMLQHTGKHEVIQYRDQILPLIRIEKYLTIPPPPEVEELSVVVFQIENHQVGFIVTEILDIVDIDHKIESSGIEYEGVLGTCIINGKITQIIDAYKLISKEFPEWFQKKEVLYGLEEPKEQRVLLVDDSSFIRSIERSYLESEGYQVVEAQNGKEAWELLNTHDFDFVITDIDMPEMNGLELTRAIRSDSRFMNLPVVAVSSLAEPEHIEYGRKAGVSAYLKKLNRDELIETLSQLLKEEPIFDSAA